MRELILLGAAAMALSACDSGPSAEERAAAEQNVTSEVVTTNDTTAIDAATGQAANMAADVPFLPEAGNEADGNEAAPAAATRRPRSTPRAPAPEPSEPETSGEDEDEPEADTL